MELHRAAQAEADLAHPSQYFKLTQQAWKADWKRAWILDSAGLSNRKGDSSSHRFATRERTLGEYEYETAANQLIKEHKTTLMEATKKIDTLFDDLDDGTKDRKLLMDQKTALELLHEKVVTLTADFQNGVGAGKLLAQQGVRIISQNQQLSAEIAALRE